MKKHIFVFAVMAVLTMGCAHNTAGVNAPTNNHESSDPCVKDNFDKAGKDVADGSRYVWNESKKAWEWVTSDENKKRLEDMENAARAAYDAAMKYYQDHKDDHKDDQNQGNN